jgi:arsenate reductase (glutaredoxin)
MITLYFVPSCSKSRGAAALLDERGVEHTIHDYVKDPLDEATLTELVTMVGGDPTDMVRSSTDASTIGEVVAQLLADPADMQRPIGVRDGKAIIARPPERILELLDHD